MRSDVTVVIPAHPARVRNGMLQRALDSVWAQTLLPEAVSVAVDIVGEGAAKTRQRALNAVETPYVAFLDSDDEFLPQHLQRLRETQEQLGASFVFSWYEPVGFGSDPLGHFGLPFNPHAPHHTTSVILCETHVAKEIGFTQQPPGSTVANDDWWFTLNYCKVAIERGLLMTHLAERTWRYHFHGQNTSGMTHLGDAAI